MSPTFFTLCLVLIWVGVFYVKRQKVNHLEEKESRTFWERESRANSTRKQDLNELPYIELDPLKLPLDVSSRSDSSLSEQQILELNRYESRIQSLASKKIVNLSAYSNTDLKLKYGAANLPVLMEYDQNYLTLLQTLSGWGQCLADCSLDKEAIQVLEYGVLIGMDMKKPLLLLERLLNKSSDCK
ncbi:MAG: hypothetical protein PUB10_03040 [Clostridiales bacterium]|nr:hypothetical protein [Clostridiales bacterium]